MKGQNYRGGKSYASASGSAATNGVRRPNGRNNGHVKDALHSPVADAAPPNKMVELLARCCGKTVVATVSSGAKLRGVLQTVDMSASGNAPLSAVLAHPVVVSRSLTNEKTNADENLPERLIILAKDLIDIEVTFEKVGEALEKNAEKPEAKADAKTEAKPAAKIAAATPETIEATPATNEAKLVKVAEKAKSPLHEELKFKTDRDISAGYSFKEKEFERWVPDANTPVLTLDESSGGAWDQFKANEEKFGVESTYDEHLYTTRINKEAKDYRDRLQRAERIAREIEGLSTTDVHVMEERGIAVNDSGLDEEDKYSGVQGDVVDTRGNELMAALRNASLSGGSPTAPHPGKYSTRQKAAQYHNDPAIVSSSATKKPLEKEEQKKPTSIPPKPQLSPAHTESFRLNAQSEINALRQFSANFKIPHKMPNDLLPILAKDKGKQDEILRKQEERSPDPKKDLKPFKLNPKAAAFTPSKSLMSPPSYNKTSTNPSPRMHNLRPYSNSSTGSVRKFHQITAADFFGGADKVPTAARQKEMIKTIRTAFNMFVTATKAHTDKSTPVTFERTYFTPPTWTSTVEDNYEKVIADQTSQSKGPGPGLPYMSSPIMAVPAAGPHMAAGGFPNKYPPMQGSMHFQQQQQLQAAMFYQQMQGGVPPGQPLMYGPPGVDPQFIPSGFVIPGFVGTQSPGGNMNMNGAPYANTQGHNYGRRNFNSQKRGSNGQ